MQSPAFRLLLFGISITAAALAQVDSITTYTSDVKCQSSFCDAFFEDDQICSVTGEGKASVQEIDEGGCGITITDAEVTCSVPCNQQGKVGKEGNDDDDNSFAALFIAFTFLPVLAVFALLIVLADRRYRKKRGPEDALRELSSLVMLEKGLTVEQDEYGKLWIKRTETLSEDEEDEKLDRSMAETFEEQRSHLPQNRTNKSMDYNEESRPLSQLL